MYSEEQIKTIFCKEFNTDIDFNDKLYLDIAQIIVKYTHLVLYVQENIKSSILNRAYYTMQQIPRLKDELKEIIHGKIIHSDSSR